jgi:hypothetical protein
MTDAQVSGTTIIDTIGGLNGTAGSSVSSTSGPPGGSQARLFDNDANTYCSLASVPISDWTQDYTIAFWLNPTDITLNPYDGPASTPCLFKLFDSNSASICLRPVNSSSGYASPPTPPFDAISFNAKNTVPVNLSGYPFAVANIQVSGQWAHVAITNASGVVNVYVNSVLASQTVMTDRTATSTNNTIGAADVANRPAIAAMAQFIIYPRALSAGEVAQLYMNLR